MWFHGDVAHGNLLVVNGKLSAVIDFGTSGIGDPACDLVLAWTMLHDNSRKAFREAVDQPEDTRARARGWALWKALVLLSKCDATDQKRAAINTRVIDEILTDHDRFG